MDSDGLPIVGPNVDFTKVLCTPDLLITVLPRSMNLRYTVSLPQTCLISLYTLTIHKTRTLAREKQYFNVACHYTYSVINKN